MKRQRNEDGATTAAKTKKTAKREADQKGKEEVEEEVSMVRESVLAVSDNLIGWEECYPWLDEQMAWGSIWLPFWDVEFMCEVDTAFFGDFAWFEDIWNLKSIKEVPKP